MYVFLASVALLVIGAFLPWVNMGLFSVSGVEGDGVITLILAIIAIIIYFTLKKKPKVVKITTIIAGAVSLIITFVSFSNIGELPFGSFGGGLILTAVGAIGLIISGFLKSQP